MDFVIDFVIDIRIEERGKVLHVRHRCHRMQRDLAAGCERHNEALRRYGSASGHVLQEVVRDFPQAALEPGRPQPPLAGARAHDDQPARSCPRDGLEVHVGKLRCAGIKVPLQVCQGRACEKIMHPLARLLRYGALQNWKASFQLQHQLDVVHVHHAQILQQDAHVPRVLLHSSIRPVGPGLPRPDVGRLVTHERVLLVGGDGHQHIVGIVLLQELLEQLAGG